MFVPPSLNDRCSRHFTYRELVECGQTFHDLAATPSPVDNTPQHELTWMALRHLANDVLDPLVDHYPSAKLTYGFCGRSLSRHIRIGVAHDLDQHASHEVNSRGKAICARGGAAADVVVRGTSSREVVAWLIGHTPFDRIYFYGAERPVHVSWTPQPVALVCNVETRAGRRMPRRPVTGAAWLSAR